MTEQGFTGGTAHPPVMDASQLDMPAGGYRNIMVDPPWDYNREFGWHGYNGVERFQVHPRYTLMTVDEICGMGPFIRSLANPEGCSLWLWTTTATERFTERIREAWQGGPDLIRGQIQFPAGVHKGQQWIWKATYAWVKNLNGMGVGRWCRNDLELLHHFVRGKVSPPKRAESNIILAPRTGHSSKPDAAYELINRLYPGVPGIDVFGRSYHYGFDRWGDGK